MRIEIVTPERMLTLGALEQLPREGDYVHYVVTHPEKDDQVIAGKVMAVQWRFVDNKPERNTIRLVLEPPVVAIAADALRSLLA